MLKEDTNQFMFTFRDTYGGNNHSAEGVTCCEIAIQVSFEVEIICSISVLQQMFLHRFEE